jgi:hypothetical protein
MHEQMSLRCLPDLPAKDQEALDIFAGRGDLAWPRLDHIMKAQDQPAVWRERGKLGGSREFGPRMDKMCVTPAPEYSVRLVLIGSLSRWQARQKFSRITAGKRYGERPVPDRELSKCRHKLLYFHC